MTSPTPHDHFPVIELRRYTMAPGARAAIVHRFDDTLAHRFQHLGGMAFGHFCERDRPDGFAWLRGFRTPAARARIVRAFDDLAHTGGMADRTDVLVLRPLKAGAGIAPLPMAGEAQGIVIAQILPVAPGRMAACERAAERCFAAYHGCGVIEAGILTTPGECAADGALVWLGILSGDAALAALRPAFDAAAAELGAAGLLAAPPELLVLDPGRRSRLRWVSAASVTAPARSSIMAAA
ncbi:NIPSNAP family protein [Massilia frigida]|nr:NIPSNAP family protein [Massilia frigida]